MRPTGRGIWRASASRNADKGGSTMTQAKRRSTRKRGKAAWALGAAGVSLAGASLAMTSAASATAPTTNAPSQDNARRLMLGEEEFSDVTLATFHVFDRENPPLSQGIKVARGGGCGCGGCAHGGGCGGCAHAAGCAGCAHAAIGGGCAAIGGRCAVGGCAAAGCVVGRCAIGRCAVVGRCACRGGCACAGVWIGVACLGCAACSGSCWQWDPNLAQWINVCY
jgi:hypothetical protein